MENKDINVTKTFEELADIEAYKKAGKDCCEWLRDSIWSHKRYSHEDIELPTDEHVYWTLGINPDKPFSKAVLESLIEQEVKKPDPHFNTIPTCLARIEWLCGWRDMQHIANTIEAVREVLKERKKTYVTEIGEDFHEDFLKTLDEKQSKWDKKCDTAPNLTSDEMPTEYNILFHGLLERLSEHCYKCSFVVSDEQSDLMFAKPENIQGHVIEKRGASASNADVRKAVEELRSLKGGRPTDVAKEVEELRIRDAAMKAAPNGNKRKAMEIAEETSSEKMIREAGERIEKRKKMGTYP